MRNRIGLLGLLGFTGFLGLLTDNPGFYGFFGFFGFFGYLTLTPDERFMANVHRAAARAFFAGLVLYPLVVAVGAMTNFLQAYAVGFALNFALQIFLFSVLLTWYENHGTDR